jgi:hypothetical protein
MKNGKIIYNNIMKTLPLESGMDSLIIFSRVTLNGCGYIDCYPNSEGLVP